MGGNVVVMGRLFVLHVHSFTVHVCDINRHHEGDVFGTLYEKLPEVSGECKLCAQYSSGFLPESASVHIESTTTVVETVL